MDATMVGTQKVTRCLITNQSHLEPKQMEQFSFGGSGVCVCVCVTGEEFPCPGNPHINS